MKIFLPILILLSILHADDNFHFSAKYAKSYEKDYSLYMSGVEFGSDFYIDNTFYIPVNLGLEAFKVEPNNVKVVNISPSVGLKYKDILFSDFSLVTGVALGASLQFNNSNDNNFDIFVEPFIGGAYGDIEIKAALRTTMYYQYSILSIQYDF